MKLEFNPQRIVKNPGKSFDIFSQKVMKSIKRQEKVDASAFSCELMSIGDVFEKQGKKPVMNKMAQRLAETLVNIGDSNLSGIIYSFLIKFNKDNAKIAEQIALNALAIANRQKDSIHIMARSYDLKEMHRIVNSLPRDYKVPFSMHVSGFKYREIADRLGLPLGTVKSRIFFTRQRLQQELKDFV